MPSFSKGDKVWYIPDHAEDESHPDAEAGVVKEARKHTWPSGPPDDKQKYLVNYSDDSGVAELTYERHLEPRDLDQ